MSLWRTAPQQPDERALPIYETLEEEFGRLHPNAGTRPADSRSWRWTFSADTMDREIVDLPRFADKLHRGTDPVARLIMARSEPALVAAELRMRKRAELTRRTLHAATDVCFASGASGTTADDDAQRTADQLVAVEALLRGSQRLLPNAEPERGASERAPLDAPESREARRQRLHQSIDDVMGRLGSRISAEIGERRARASSLHERLGAFVARGPAAPADQARIDLGRDLAEHLNAVLEWDALWSDAGVSALRRSAFCQGLCHTGPDYDRSGTQVNRLILEEAFVGELAQTKDRRLSVLYAAVHAMHNAAGPNAEKRAALCLSGGGIRSATFALGVVQGLAKYGLLDSFTYLSTVSGGGYLGGWLTAWMHHSSPSTVIDALNCSAERDASSGTWPAGSARPLDPEAAPLHHLREYSNYLSPSLGLLSADTWTLAATYLRNLFLNWLVIVPFLGGALIVPRLLSTLFRLPQATSGWSEGFAIAAALMGALLGSIAVSTVHRNRPPSESAHRSGLSQPAFIRWCLVPMLAGSTLVTLWWEWSDGRLFWGGTTTPIGVGFALVAGIVIHTIGWLGGIRGWELKEWLGGFATREPGGQQRVSVVPIAQLGRALGAVVVSGAVAGAILLYAARGLDVASRAIEAVWPFGVRYGVGHHEIFAVLAVPAFMAIVLIAGFIYVGATSRRSKDQAREWSARYSAWLLIAIVAWVAIFAIVLIGPALFANGIALALGISVGTVAGAATLTLGRSAVTPATEKARDSAAARAARAGMGIVARRWGLALAAPAFAVTVLVLLSTFDAVMLRGACALPYVADSCTGAGTFLATAALTPSVVVGVVGALLVAAGWVLGRFFIHANKFSLHAMYRARLIRAYLGASRPAGERRPDPFTGFDEDDNIALHKLGPRVGQPSATRQPFHVVNVALNLVSGDSLAWQERKAASFTFTPLHAGSPFVGYRRTSPTTVGSWGGRCYASEPASLSLGTAITISGAAASPNMGYHSSPVVTFLMTLFNARLGWWLGNPGPAGDGTFHLSHPKDSIKPLLAEMFGLTTDRHEYVYLSDGGHFDNLGLYEMVLRRCRFIVVSDAGCDQSFSFEDLGNAIRKIRIDLGVPIEFPNGFPLYGREEQAKRPEAALGRYCTIGTIRYSCVDDPAAATRTDSSTAFDRNYDGVIVYLKPCFYARDEPRDVFNYAQSNAAFPHEPTSDQFFSESQFESYRALGFHIIDSICTHRDTAAARQAARYRQFTRLDGFGYDAQFHADVKPGSGFSSYEPPATSNPTWPPRYRYVDIPDDADTPQT